MTLLLFGQIIVEDLFCFEMSLTELLWWAFVRLTLYIKPSHQLVIPPASTSLVPAIGMPHYAQHTTVSFGKL